MKLRIPKAAWPVVRVIRREVERPKELPEPYRPTSKDSLTFTLSRCPMGLYPLAKDERPICVEMFPYNVSDSEIESFYEWWDSQTDAQAAVDAVWGKR